MKKIDIEKIMAELRKGVSPDEGEHDGTTNTNDIPHKQSATMVEDAQLADMNEEELLVLLQSYQNQFLEMLNFQSFEPAFSEFGRLQEELNASYRILMNGKTLPGIIGRLLRKLLGMKEILARQEQFNAITTRTLNRSIEIKTSITREIYQIRTQLYFISMQSKVMKYILTDLQKTLNRLARDHTHQVRREEYLAAIIPRLHEIQKKFESNE